MMIELQISRSLADAAGAGLLVPGPSGTTDQRFVGLDVPSHVRLSELVEKSSGQSAFLLRGLDASPLHLRYRFRLEPDRRPTDIFVDFANRFTAFDGDIDAFLEIDDPRPSAHAVVAAVQRKFTYGPRNYDHEFATAFCGVGSGNCIDINTVLLACLRGKGIEAAYQAGFFFASPDSGCVADGMHCWVSTREHGLVRHWDVAHCLQAGLDAPIAALNPKGGCRVAVSFGRGLQFASAGLEFPQISHFARPQWLGTGGFAREAEIRTVIVSEDALYGDPAEWRSCDA